MPHPARRDCAQSLAGDRSALVQAPPRPFCETRNRGRLPVKRHDGHFVTWLRRICKYFPATTRALSHQALALHAGAGINEQKCLCLKLRQLVQKQHAVMGQRHFARPRTQTAADQSRHGEAE